MIQWSSSGCLMLGLLIGLVVGWRVKAHVNQSKNSDNQAHRERLESLNIEVTELKTTNRLSNNNLAESKQALAHVRQTAFELQAQLSEANANYKNLEEKLKTQTHEREHMQTQFTTQFENLANKILDEKTTRFTKQNQENLEGVLKPFNEKLTEFKKKVEETYTQESYERASLKGEINQLFQLNQTMAKEAKNLTTALKGGSKAQGNWGELLLETILEKSGLRKGEEFVTQESFHTDDGKRQHPDVILNLPEKKHIIIDSKVSLTAYERYFSAEDESEKERALKHHVASIQTHIKQLSGKQYQNLDTLNSPDFVLMFMPIEPAFGLALQYDPSLFLNALHKNVMMVSPSTLLATLQIIANIWKQDRQNRHSLEIARQGGALYDKFVLLHEDLKKLGKQLTTAMGTYDNTVKKLATGNGNLIRQVEKIKDMGAKATKSISNSHESRNDQLESFSDR